MEFLFLILVVVFFWICLDDSIVVIEYVVETEKVNQPVKLAVISDFHSTNAKEVVKHIHTIQPDVILIPGDLIDENRQLDSVQELLIGLQEFPSYYVSGNHEYKVGRIYKNIEQIKDLLSQHGIHYLSNSSKIVDVNGQKLWIGGIEDHRSLKQSDPNEVDQCNLKKVCDELDESLFSVLLMHRPEQYQLVEKYPIDVLISGHAHGGQVRLPFINGLFAPQQGLFPKRAGGVYPMKSGIHLVSRGLAHYWFLPRINNHREINVLSIKNRAD